MEATPHDVNVTRSFAVALIISHAHTTVLSLCYVNVSHLDALLSGKTPTIPENVHRSLKDQNGL